MRATDPALTWLRAVVREIATSLGDVRACPSTTLTGRHDTA
jgi:hypothetical protein